MTLHDLDQQARALGLAVRGAFHPDADDLAPEGCRTLVLLGPDEPSFWPLFKTAPEMTDGKAHPLDRWSKRITLSLSSAWNATAVFPYDGPPYAPFLQWADRSDGNWRSPVGLLVHKDAGLFISFRAALALPVRLELPAPKPPSPCQTCATKPCATACPVGALSADQAYDVPRCLAHVESDAGADCRNGCLVRRACPVSQAFGRLPEQSAFHMRAFLGE